MKKAINILFLCSRILSLVVIAIYATLATVFLFVGIFNAGQGIGDSVKYFIASLFTVVAAYLAFTRQTSLEERGPRLRYDSIWCIVIGVIGSVPTLAAAGIVALIYDAKAPKAIDEGNVVDEKKED